MIMKLLSDFSCYYDHMFDYGPIKEGEELFIRLSTAGLNRRDQFALMERAGFDVVKHGMFNDIYESWWEEQKQWCRSVVVYDDEMAHCGYGKRLIGKEALRWDGCISRLDKLYKLQEELSLKYCSAFVGHPHQLPSCSFRLLQIGPHRFWLEYQGFEDWRSNYGNGKCEVVGVEMNYGFNEVIRYPLWAIDFAIGRSLWAIDFNNAPGIRGSGVENIFSANKAYRAILEGHRYYGQGQAILFDCTSTVGQNNVR